MFGWHHRNEFEQALRDGAGQRSLVSYSPWSHKESDMTERLGNNNNIKYRKNSCNLSATMAKLLKKWAENVNRIFFPKRGVQITNR